MKAFQPYLNFQGTTRDAMTFYQKALDAELTMQTFGEVGAPGPAGTENLIMHARLSKGSAVIMASDALPGMPFTQGNNYWVNCDCDSVEEIEKVFAALGEGGKVLMPLADQFWGARFGMLTDKFGLNWMFNCELAKA
jgi:PhnB protein